MRLISFINSKEPRIGIVVDEGQSVIDLSLLAADIPNNNSPLAGHKRSVYEGGIRVPASPLASQMVERTQG